MEYRWYGRDMEIIWFHCRGTVVRGKEGNVRLLVGSITEGRKRRKKRLAHGIVWGKQAGAGRGTDAAEGRRQRFSDADRCG